MIVIFAARTRIGGRRRPFTAKKSAGAAGFRFHGLFCLLFLLIAAYARPEDARWYRSNAAGMRLEEIPSRFAALRNEYALSRASGSPGELPAEVISCLAELPVRTGQAFSPVIEIQTLYQKGIEIRRQWTVQSGGVTRIAAAFALGGEQAEAETAASGGDASGTPEGFVEMFDGRGLVFREYQFTPGKETVVVYSYNGDTPVRAETSEKEGGTLKPLYTDTYRYRRSGSLRQAERVYHASGERTRLSFRGGFPGADDDFIGPQGSGYDMPDAVYLKEDYRVVYSTDERGRVLSESFYDEKDELFGVLSNTWSGDRLTSVSWKTAAGDEERLSEFEYDAEGDRIAERNYRRGVLERAVTRSGERDIEELYMNGNVILRAVWEDGRKISEERIQER
ncbi:MAG: hypothetical protein LBG42_06660 [Treponema sp.]|jgi:hypothetical protein|nr:hypothetical protein [Treponema sp.]